MPRRISYDNLAIAVIEVLQGRERKLTKEFLRLQSYYLFQEHFCFPMGPPTTDSPAYRGIPPAPVAAVAAC